MIQENAPGDVDGPAAIAFIDVRQWVALAGLAVTSFVIGGLCAVAIGLWIGPIAQELRWSSAQAGSIATAFLLAAIFAAPIVGFALDRVGPRLVMTFGIACAALGLSLAATARDAIALTLSFVLIGIGYSSAFYVTPAVVASNIMGDRRSLGTGVIWCAMSVGAALFSGALGWGAEIYGWRMSAWASAALMVLILPLPYLALPRRMQAPQRAAAERTTLSVFTSRTFIVVTAASVAFGLSMSGIYYHIVSILVEAGYALKDAGLLFGASWILSAIGSVLLGGAALRGGAQKVLSTAMLACALGTFLLLGVGHPSLGLASVIGFLVLWGGAANVLGQFVPVLFAERLGSAHLGALVGAHATIIGIVSAGAPMLTGYLHDRFSDYRLAISFSTAMMFLACVTLLVLGRQKTHA